MKHAHIISMIRNLASFHKSHSNLTFCINEWDMRLQKIKSRKQPEGVNFKESQKSTTLPEEALCKLKNDVVTFLLNLKIIRKAKQ